MVATRPRLTFSVMTPGMNSMLRARRKDKDIRPNRFLDRTASRGMLYENEGLRLRTMNINADLEKGQQYIKKLRRENSQLRREIWNLRDQYDKLETMISRSQNQEQEADEYNCKCGGEIEDLGILSSVPEESENEDLDSTEDLCTAGGDNDSAEKIKQSPNLAVDVDQLDDLSKKFGDLNPAVASPMQNDVTQLNGDGATKSDAEHKMCSLKTCEHFVDLFRKNSDDQKSFVFSVNGLDNLTAQDVIDNLEQHFKNECHSIFDGVRLTNRHCFLRVKDVDNFRKAIETVGDLSIRGQSIQLEDVWERSSILQLSAVPQHVADEQLVAIISRFADVIGNIERQNYKGLDTGERFVHVITPNVIPCQLLIGSVCIPITIVHSRRKNSSIARRKSFRSQININLKTPDLEADETSSKLTNSLPLTPPDTDRSNASVPEPPLSSKSTGLNPKENETNVFQFPNTPNAATPQVTTLTPSKKKKEPPPQLQQLSNGTKDAKNSGASESPSVFRRLAQRSVNSFRGHHATCENSRPPSPAVFPGTPRLRRSSVNFRIGPGDFFNRSRQTDCCLNEPYPGYVRERSASDASSRICVRKLSVTGHESSTKIPWCGCWGIGCC